MRTARVLAFAVLLLAAGTGIGDAGSGGRSDQALRADWASWRADAKAVAYDSADSPLPGLQGPPTVWTLELASGVVRWPIRAFGLTRPIWSPDPRFIAVEWDDAIVVCDIEQARA